MLQKCPLSPLGFGLDILTSISVLRLWLSSFFLSTRRNGAQVQKEFFWKNYLLQFYLLAFFIFGALKQTSGCWQVGTLDLSPCLCRRCGWSCVLNAHLLRKKTKREETCIVACSSDVSPSCRWIFRRRLRFIRLSRLGLVRAFTSALSACLCREMLIMFVWEEPENKSSDCIFKKKKKSFVLWSCCQFWLKLYWRKQKHWLFSPWFFGLISSSLSAGDSVWLLFLTLH